MKTDGACFIPEEHITILRPLLWNDDNWRSMFHDWEIHCHPLTVVIRPCQLAKHVSYLGAYHHALSGVMGRWQLTEHIAILHILVINNHALSVVMRRRQLTWMIYCNKLTVVMRRWQLTEHESYLRNILPCSGRYHETKVTDRACFIP